MPQLDPSSYASQLFWLVVTFTVLFLIIWKHVSPKIGGIKENRQTKVDADLAKAESLKEKAQSVKDSYEADLAKAAQDARAIHQEAADAIAKKAEKEHGDLGAKLAEQAREANERISAAKNAAVGDMKAASVEVVQAATERLIGASIDGATAQAALDASEKEAR